MSHMIKCHLCSYQVSVSNEVFERRISGKKVTLRCKRCRGAISIDGTDAQKPVVVVPAPAGAVARAREPEPESASLEAVQVDAQDRVLSPAPARHLSPLWSRRRNRRWRPARRALHRAP